MELLEELGGVDTYNHYPTGWAWAFNTPYKMFKRFSLEGGIADPCIVAYTPRTHEVAGQIRDQYHHAIDVAPTMLDLAGVEPPGEIGGIEQSRIDSVSMAYAVADASVASARTTQY